jgi:hypothetical protein
LATLGGIIEHVTESLGSLEVAAQLELGRRHDWQAGGLLAFEDAAGIEADQEWNLP